MAGVLAQGRIQTLDLVRGVAVMGILLLNILSFAMPEAAYYNPRAYGGAEGADLAAYLINFVWFDGKMRGLFSVLFGASMLLVIERAEASGRDPAAVHYARMGWLLVFGLAHLWLVWRGDILAHYALVGMLAFAFRGMATAQLLVMGGLLALLGMGLSAGFPAMAHDLALPATDPAAAAANAQQLHQLAISFGVPPASEIARELAVMRGGYGGILAERFADTKWLPINGLSFLGPETLAYMLFGMAGLKSGMLTGNWTAARYRRWLMVCWGIALPVYVLLAAYMVWAGFSLFSVTLAAVTLTAPVRPLMIAGWVCLILLLAPRLGQIGARIGAVGRMAFTNYLVTSLICTTLFYGYGLGWFGHMSRWQLYPVVALVWAGMLLWSKPWLAGFRFGPFEWLWRSLARGRLQPLRGGAPT